MPSKSNLDVNIVNYLIAHKSTIGADSAMNDISFPRQSWGEGRFAMGNISVCFAPTSPPLPGLLEAAFPNSQRGKLFPQNPLEIPWIHPLPQKGSGVWQALLLVQEDTKAINTIFVLRVITSAQQQLDISWSNYSFSQIWIYPSVFILNVIYCSVRPLVWSDF